MIAITTVVVVLVLALKATKNKRETFKKDIETSTAEANSSSTLMLEKTHSPKIIETILIKKKPLSGIFQFKECPAGFVGTDCSTECGVTNRGVTNSYGQFARIVGGEVAAEASWPAHIYLRMCHIDHTDQCTYCGGTLIDLSTVITAAHCIEDPSRHTFDVFVGLHDTDQVRQGAALDHLIHVTHVIKHPSYNEAKVLYDIAILKLAVQVSLSDTVQVACLPQTADLTFPMYNQPAWAVGWGRIKYNESKSDLLRHVDLHIHNPVACGKYAPGKNWSTQICAGDRERKGGKDTCQGDSGGPLYVMDMVGGKAKYVLAGITSFGIGCASAEYPGIYTRVSAFLNWISAYREHMTLTNQKF